jgi:nicotinate-nucleotide adenylyltransferase
VQHNAARDQRTRPRRLGIFGGTFDPVHLGHLVAATNARALLDLDEVVFVVANDPWQKSDDRQITSAVDRLALVEAALAGHTGLVASGLEIARGGPSYTIDTVEALLADEPDAELYLIIGADVVPGLPTWQRPDELRRLAQLAVLTRPGAPLEFAPEAVAGWRLEILSVPLLDISSTDLRARARDGRPLDFLVPDAAIRLIGERGLYAVSR